MVTVGEGVREYLDYLEVERGLAANTVEAYWRDLHRYQFALADRGRSAMDEVTAADVSPRDARTQPGHEQ